MGIVRDLCKIPDGAGSIVSSDILLEADSSIFLPGFGDNCPLRVQVPEDRRQDDDVLRADGAGDTGVVQYLLQHGHCHHRNVRQCGTSVCRAGCHCCFSRSYFFGEDYQKKAIALLVNVLGCVLTVTGGSLNAGNLVLSGVLFGIGAGVCYGMVAILGRVTTAKVNPFVAITWTFFFGSIFILLFVRPWNEAVFPTNAGFVTVGLLFALIPTTFSYLFYFSGVSVIKETSKVPVIASIEPVVATLIGVIAYHEPIGVINVLGILLVIGSIVMMNQKQLD